VARETPDGGEFESNWKIIKSHNNLKGMEIMKTRTVKEVQIKRSSGNVFADLELADAEKLKIKTGLVIEIRKATNKIGLTQKDVAHKMGISQPKVCDMMRGNFSNQSERKLMDCLMRLGYDIEIKVRPAKFEVGHLMLNESQG